MISIDITGLENYVCDNFIITHADSGTQVKSIADGVEEHVKKKLNFIAVHKEGYENLQWILLDFGSVIVHIFQEEIRKYYQIEKLWADGKIERFSDDEDSKN